MFSPETSIAGIQESVCPMHCYSVLLLLKPTGLFCADYRLTSGVWMVRVKKERTVFSFSECANHQFGLGGEGGKFSRAQSSHLQTEFFPFILTFKNIQVI